MDAYRRAARQWREDQERETEERRILDLINAAHEARRTYVESDDDADYEAWQAIEQQLDREYERAKRVDPRARRGSTQMLRSYFS